VRAIALLVHCFQEPTKMESGLASFSGAQKKWTWSEDDVATDRPSVASAGFPPFLDENSGDRGSGKDGPPPKSAGGNVVNRLIDPDALEPAQMPMHRRSCSRGR